MPTTTARHGYFNIVDKTPGWHYWMNANLETFNAIGKRVMALRDVNTLVLKNKSIIKYNSTTAKWEVVIRRT